MGESKDQSLLVKFEDGKQIQVTVQEWTNVSPKILSAIENLEHFAGRWRDG